MQFIIIAAVLLCTLQEERKRKGLEVESQKSWCQETQPIIWFFAHSFKRKKVARSFVKCEGMRSTLFSIQETKSTKDYGKRGKCAFYCTKSWEEWSASSLNFSSLILLNSEPHPSSLIHSFIPLCKLLCTELHYFKSAWEEPSEPNPVF